jgi:hypothetical protein
MQSVTTWKKRKRKKAANQKKQRCRILQTYENKYPTHLKMAMAETCSERQRKATQ